MCPGWARRRQEGRVWVHAVSVGETVAAAPVVAAVRAALPGAAILISTTTPDRPGAGTPGFPATPRSTSTSHSTCHGSLRRVLDRIRPSASC